MPKLHLESCSKWLSNITPSQPLCLFILVSVWWFHQSPSTKESVTFDQAETDWICDLSEYKAGDILYYTLLRSIKKVEEIPEK